MGTCLTKQSKKIETIQKTPISKEKIKYVPDVKLERIMTKTNIAKMRGGSDFLRSVLQILIEIDEFILFLQNNVQN